jgi:zinc D-Ala-D-Ala carboxypeptidase
MYRVILGRGDIAFETNIDLSLSKNFKLSEFASKDKSKEVKINYLIIDKLQMLRNTINADRKSKGLPEIPIIITSGYRSKEHNKNVGGAEESLHTEGLAVDIFVNTDLVYFAELANKIGFSGIGIYKKHLHLDLGIRRFWDNR